MRPFHEGAAVAQASLRAVTERQRHETIEIGARGSAAEEPSEYAAGR